jgi:hypothetical protein
LGVGQAETRAKCYVIFTPETRSLGTPRHVARVAFGRPWLSRQGSQLAHDRLYPPSRVSISPQRNPASIERQTIEHTHHAGCDLALLNSVHRSTAGAEWPLTALEN